MHITLEVPHTDSAVCLGAIIFEFYHLRSCHVHTYIRSYAEVTPRSYVIAA